MSIRRIIRFLIIGFIGAPQLSAEPLFALVRRVEAVESVACVAGAVVVGVGIAASALLGEQQRPPKDLNTAPVAVVFTQKE